MFDQIKSDLTTAMKEKDTFKLNVIRMLKSAVQMEAIEKKKDLSDDEVIAVIKREVKKRNSSVEEYTKYGKDALAKIVEETIIEVGAESIKDMGNVIKTISAKYGAQADMSKVSKIVKEKLS